jgi:hypothetical protein
MPSVGPFAFDQTYALMFDLAIMEDAKAAVSRSADRYMRAIGTRQAPR